MAGVGQLRLVACVIDLDQLQVVRAEAVTSLSPTEGRLLSACIERAGEVLTREELLTQVFGYHPDTRSGTLATTMRRLRQKIERDPGNPDHLLTVRGRGYRFEWAGGAAIEQDASSFVGRSRELIELAQHLGVPGARVAILGMGGVGKTRLARRYADRWQGHAAFCELESATDSSGVIRGIARAAGVRAGNVESLGAALRDGPVDLLVLDNLEQAVCASAEVVKALAEHAPRLRVVMTSRQALHVGEAIVQLAPLDRDEATRLLVDRAEQARGGSTRGAEPALLHGIVDALEGLPLAIELAAARLRVLGLPALAERLGDRFQILRRRGPSEGRASALHAAIAWSWELLEPDQQGVLAQLSSFRGGFDAEAAEGVVRCQGDPLDLLEELVDRSLLQVRGDGSTLRFAMLESVREFAAGQLGPQADAVAQRHANWFAVSAQPWCEAGYRGEDAGHARLVLELDNLLIASERSVLGHPKLLVRLAHPIHVALLRLGSEHSSVSQLERALRSGPTGADALQLLTDLSDARRVRCEWEQGAEVVKTGAELDSEALPSGLRARFWQSAGSLALEQGHADVASERYQLAQTLAEQSEDAYVLATILVNRSALLRYRGRNAEALASLSRASELARQLDNKQLLGHTLCNLGGLQFESGRLDEAAPTLRRALELVADNARARSLAQLNLGALHLERGEPEQALPHLERARAGCAAIKDRRAEGVAALNTATVLQELGDYERALDHLSDALERMTGGDTRYIAIATAQRGAVLHERGETPGARRDYDRSIELLREVGDVRFLAAILARRGLLLDSASDLAEASELASRAGDPMLVVAVELYRSADPDVENRATSEPVGMAPSAAAWSSEVRLAIRLRS